MNSSIIRFILGYVLKTEAALLLLPCLIALIYSEKEGIWYLPVAAVCLLLGLLMTRRKPTNSVFYLKEGCIATSLSWILLSFFGCLPFCLTGRFLLLRTPYLKRSPALPPPAPAS